MNLAGQVALQTKVCEWCGCLSGGKCIFLNTNTKWLHLSEPCYLVFTLLKFFTKTEPNKQWIENRKKESKLTFGQWARGVPEQVRFQLQDQRFPQWCLQWRCTSPEPPHYGRRRSYKHRYLQANENKLCMNFSLHHTFAAQLIFEMKASSAF